MKIRIEGDVRQNHSLSLINRGIALGLEDRGWQVSVEEQSIRTDNLLEDNARINRMCKRKENVDIILRQHYPPKLDTPKGGSLLVVSQPWEVSMLPPKWIDFYNQHADYLVGMSQWNCQIFKNSGINSPSKLIPVAIDDVFFEDHKPLKTFDNGMLKILFVGGCVHRKGFDVALNVMDLMFGGNPDVQLVVKTSKGYNASGQPEWIDQVDLNVCYTNETISNELLARLYTSCDIFLFPSRAEGFGLTPAEALCCGLDVVSTNKTGLADFINDSNSRVIESEYQQCDQDIIIGSNASKDFAIPYCECAEPSIDDTVRKLSSCFTSKRRCTKEEARQQLSRYRSEVVIDEWDKFLRSLI